MFRKHKIGFVSGIIAGIAVGGTLGVLSQSRQAKQAYRRFSHTPVGKSIKNLTHKIG